MIEIDNDKCTQCGLCVEICPCEAVIEVEGCYNIDPELCVACEVCIEECLAKAIQFKMV